MTGRPDANGGAGTPGTASRPETGGGTGQLVEAYLAWLAGAQARSANTVAAYRRDLVAWSAFLAARGVPAGRAGTAEVESYVAHLAGAGRAPSSVARALVALRSFHRWVARHDTAATDPTSGVDGPRVARAPRELTEAEVGRVLAAVGGDGALARRDRAILELLYGLGLRISDLVALDVDDVAAGDTVVLVARRPLPLVGEARGALRAWLAARPAIVPPGRSSAGDARALFVNAQGRRLSRQGAWGIVRRCGVTAGLGDRLGPQVLRNSCAAHLLANGAPRPAVHALLGGSGTGAGVDELRALLLRAHPRARA